MSTSITGFTTLDTLRVHLQAELPKLSGAQRRLALYVLAHAAEIPLMTTTALAQAAGISQSTVTRFACRMGFGSYAEFTDALGRILLGELQNKVPMERFRRARLNSPLAQLLDQEIAHLQGLSSAVESAEFQNSARLVAQARTVLVVGLAAGASIAVHTHLYLSRLRPQVSCVHELGAAFMTQLVHLTPEDCALIFAVPRITRDVVQMMGLLRQRGVRIIFVTDPAGLVVASGAEEIVIVPVTNSPTTAVPAAVMMLASLLVDATALLLPEESLRNLQSFERLATTGKLFTLDSPSPNWTDPTLEAADPLPSRAGAGQP